MFKTHAIRHYLILLIHSSNPRMLYLVKSMIKVAISFADLSSHNLYGIDKQVQVANLITMCFGTNNITDVLRDKAKPIQPYKCNLR